MNKTRLYRPFVPALLFLFATALGFGGPAEAPPFRVEEITIQAGGFAVVGDLYLPTKGSRHPAVVWVHGSGPMTRKLFAPLIQPQIERFLEAGFAFLIDDIPGSGASKGRITSVFEDRALILAEEIEAMRARPDIVPSAVGVAGTSQAGVVMPLATTRTSHIAFMIAEAGVAESSYRQDAYLLERFMICEGLPAGEAREMAGLYRRRFEAEDFKEYERAAERLNGHKVVKMMDLAYPLSDEAKFKGRDRSPSRLGPYFDPMPIVAGLKIPILALFGDKDCNIDPVQGVEAYRRAFETARDPLNRVEMIAGANHLLYEAKTGCVRELMAQVAEGKPLYGSRSLDVLSEWLKSLRLRLQGGSERPSPSR